MGHCLCERPRCPAKHPIRASTWFRVRYHKLDQKIQNSGFRIIIWTEFASVVPLLVAVVVSGLRTTLLAQGELASRALGSPGRVVFLWGPVYERFADTVAGRP